TSISESLKEDLEFNHRLLKAAEGCIQKSARFIEIAKEKEFEVFEVENDHEHAPQDTKPIPITIVRPITKTVLEVNLIESSSRPQPTGLVIDITSPEQSNREDQRENQSHTTPKADRGKGIARDTNESPCKLVKPSTKVRQDLDALVLIPYEINEVLYHLTNKQIHAHLEKE
ncbi:hypothetical protein Tco_0136419, partial [Tanacetum coccineum]